MKQKIYLVVIATLCSFAANAQVKIGDNPTSILSGSLLELESTNKALTLPRMTGAQMAAIPSPTNGMLIYNTDSVCICQYRGAGKWQSLCNNTDLNSTSNKQWPYHTNDRIVGANGNAQGIIALPGNGLAATGQYSHAEGFIDTASGNYSWAVGASNKAKGEGDFVFGSQNNTTVGGSWNTLMGVGNNTTSATIGATMAGGYSVVNNGNWQATIGIYDTASAEQAIAIGNSNKSSGVQAVALGTANKVSGLQAIALGNFNKTVGTYSLGLGYANYTAAQLDMALGYSDTASGVGNGAWAIGYLNKATGDRSVAIGNVNKVNGVVSVGLGQNNVINNADYATSIGTNNTVNPGGIYSFTGGLANKNSSSVGVLLGNNNNSAGNSSGYGCYGLGYGNTVNGDASVTIGVQNNAGATSNRAVLLGTINKCLTTSVGYGSYALGYGNTVGAAGDVSIGGGNNTSGGNWALAIGRDNTVSGAGNGAWAFGFNNTAALDFSMAVGIGATTTSTYQWASNFANGYKFDGGPITANGVIVTSDSRLKKNINNLSYGLNAVMQLRPVSYDKKQIITGTEYKMQENGFIAQDVQKLLPNVVTEGSDANKTLGVNYTALIPVLTKAIQEQQAQIEELKAEIKALKANKN